MNKENIAHIKQLASGEWDKPHDLEEHLLKVAEIAKAFAADLGADWAELAGRWHDLGKYRAKFQHYIRYQSGYERENAHIEAIHRAPHSISGAVHAIEQLGPGLGHILSYVIAGHHAGLPDWDGGKAGLCHRLGKDGQAEYREALDSPVSKEILESISPALPISARQADSITLWIRMLFSCLVDADFLDTENYMSPEAAESRSCYPELNILQGRFNEKMSELQSRAESTNLNSIRRDIYGACLKAAKSTPGIFSLTVPTGGGKTLASLAFALEHARLYMKKRIIYAIPFTSIIEQNAGVFRKFLGCDAVLEHHSSLDIKEKDENNRSRLASENWDAPVIVTTNVQLFESLHASRTSRCRKLHNLVNSVIVLDEAQQLPRDFHAPIVHAMKQLSEHYGVTWVLCTATQPDFSSQQDAFGKTLLEGFDQVQEITADPSVLARQLKRVHVHLPKVNEPPLSWQSLSEQLMAEECVLAIVNTRRNAQHLYNLMIDKNNTLHLSAQMCAEHRSEILETIRQRLQNKRKGKDDRPLRVITTQLIEAGVDVDFPVVYRAMAGLDSIAQAAGRCNREGLLPELGRVIVFKPETPAPPGFLRQGEQATEELIRSEQLEEPLSPDSLNAYFQLINSKGSRDKHDICELLTARQSIENPLDIRFRTAANKFKLIDNAGTALIVPFVPEGLQKEGKESPVIQWLKKLEADASQKWVYKKLQRYTVTLPEDFVEQLYAIGAVEVIAGQYLLLDSHYDHQLGVLPPDTLLDAYRSVI